MTHTANHSVLEQGKIRRALAAAWAFLQSMESTSFDYDARSNRTLGTGGGTTEGGNAPKPGSGSDAIDRRTVGMAGQRQTA